jgi:hypothetical protein
MESRGDWLHTLKGWFLACGDFGDALGRRDYVQKAKLLVFGRYGTERKGNGQRAACSEEHDLDSSEDLFYPRRRGIG